ncbi:hypothetical protein BDV98DRAFT_574538 [Pterulicium gracile]|uniref:SMODS and SLOG-associating 2TM effector domain-containing protein n=1 Tax=Pterulicium gracile TaxID=1884261 RepID=A0A5C3Q7C9_9AGAR|nr:hypothetical protein BDV98DRAFT_574538 [Pterula gracilis]
MSTSPRDPTDTTPSPSSFSRALPQLPTPGRSLLGVKSTEYTPTRHTSNPTLRPQSMAASDIIPATGFPSQPRSHDASRLSEGSAHATPRPEDRSTLAGIGAHGADPERRFSIRSPQISTFDEGGRYAAAVGSTRPPPMVGPERHSTMDTYAQTQSRTGSRSRAASGVLANGDGSGLGGTGGGSGVGWIVPADMEKNKPSRRLTVRERIQPTLELAQTERDKYASRARLTGYGLNAAIGAQVVFGALTTGLSAALSGRQVSIATAILGGFSTIVASYLARARGSNEPELSISRTKDLEQFIRECQAFQLDYGHLYGVDHTVYDPESEKTLDEGTQMERYLDARLEGFRVRFEEMLGNASGERKLAEPLGSLGYSKPAEAMASTGYKSQV